MNVPFKFDIMQKNKSVVVIPTYNEIENIRDIISAVISLPQQFDILIVDDASPDGTADAVREMQTKYENRISILCRR